MEMCGKDVQLFHYNFVLKNLTNMFFNGLNSGECPSRA